LNANKSLEIKLTSLGIVNGIVDFKLQAPYYATFAYNNTYGIRPGNYDQNAMNNQLTQLNAPGGCVDQTTQCRALMDSQDPEGEGDVAAVNAKCSFAFNTCQAIQRLFDASGRSIYDIRQKTPDPFPSQAYVEYLNTAQVQAAIGTPLNFTSSTDLIYNGFSATGDQLRGTQLAALSRLLFQGVHVALLYGDADFICNWQGGEAVSLALASYLPNYASNFPSAGYADIVVNDSYVGGAVRQFGNLSFARVYDAGHFIPAYQPETAFQVFARIISGTAVSTGEIINPSTYHTSGPQFSTKSNKQGSSKDSVCWVRNIPLGCTDAQKNGILSGQGVVFNGVWYASQGDYKPPSSSVQAGKPGTPAPNGTSFSAVNGSPTVAPTGVYVATGTPKPSGARKSYGSGLEHLWYVSFALCAAFILGLGLEV
jgi:hypothetical protein